MSDNLDFALARVDAFARNGEDTPWGLNKESVLLRVRALLKNPALIDQNGLDACGPAVFFRIWFEREPIAAATFACNLLQLGTARLGTLTVTPGPTLMAQQYEALQAAYKGDMPADADWMLLSSLRSSESGLSAYAGIPEVEGPGQGGGGAAIDGTGQVTPPGTLIRWLSDIGLYSSIQDQTSGVRPAQRAALSELLVADNQDLILFIHSRGLCGGIGDSSQVDTRVALPGDESPMRSSGQLHPNHYTFARGAPMYRSESRRLGLSLWSRGETTRQWYDVDVFFEHYFGHIVATI